MALDTIYSFLSGPKNVCASENVSTLNDSKIAADKSTFGRRNAIQSSARSLKNAGKILARVFSLSVFIHAFESLRYLTGRGRHEPLKVAIQQSRRIALARCLIHGIPVGFALFEIILNWNNYYVGVNTYSVALYQLIAKIHEIMIQASLAAIIFSFIRHELVLGGGLPFGQFSLVSYDHIDFACTDKL